MESLVSDFHIDFNLFIAQIVNFGTVFVVLYFFAFKPLIKNMGDRTEKIEKSLKDADEINRKLLEVKDERDKIIIEAKKRANEIIENANKLGEEKRLLLIARAKGEIGEIINAEKEKFVRDKELILKDIKKEVVEMVILTTKKVVGKNMNEVISDSLIKDLLE